MPEAGSIRVGGMDVTRALQWKIAGLVLVGLCLLLTRCAERHCVEPPREEPALTYIFRDGWPLDCGRGVKDRRFWYFECVGDSVRLVGYWDPAQEPEPPQWWSEAKTAMNCFDGIGFDHEPVFGPPCSDVSKTPRENREAEEMALWLSGSLVAPDDLYNAMANHLRLIRERYGRATPILNSIVFEPFWSSSYLEVGLTQDAKSEYAAGEYHDLDSLNAQLRVQWVWSGTGGSLLIRFDGRYNYYRLAEIYSAVPSVTGVLSPLPHRVCGAPGVFPWPKNPLP